MEKVGVMFVMLMILIFATVLFIDVEVLATGLCVGGLALIAFGYIESEKVRKRQ